MAVLTANAPTLIYTCPASKIATKNVRFCNTGANAATVRVWKGATTPMSGAPVTGDEWVYDLSIPANGYAETTGIYMVAGEKLYAAVSNAAVSVNQHGPERDA